MNQITAHIEFNFKGKTLTPSVELDLDSLMKQHGSIPALYQMLAKLNNIDSYSYEYEIMLEEEIQFTDAKGSVINFVQGTSFDQVGFEQQWFEDQLFNTLSPLIKQQLDIDEIDQHPKFKSIIMAAYQAGKESNS